LAAAGSAVDAGLVWEVGGAIEYYHDAADAFVFPPIPQAHWADLTGYLPGDVVYDLTPPAARFTPPRF